MQLYQPWLLLVLALSCWFGDNGPEITNEVKPGYYDRIKEFQHASMGELRGAKRDLWEKGHRVPFLATWPGRTKPGDKYKREGDSVPAG